jgi:N-acetylglucosamine malate deacetylase 1
VGNTPFQRILAVGAHPDDLEILRAGMLARYVKLGAHIVMVVATDGSAGHMLVPPDELKEICYKVAVASADLLSAELVWLGYTDELIMDDLLTRLSFVDMIRGARPDVIFTLYGAKILSTGRNRG